MKVYKFGGASVKNADAVKNVAAAYGTGDTARIAKVVRVLRRMVWATGLLGAVLTLTLSPWLRQLNLAIKTKC